MTDWESASIGDICDVINGGTPKTDVPEYWGGPHRWITPAEMGKRTTPYIDQTDRSITDQGLQNSSARRLPPYSVILSSRAPIGHLVINTAPMATNQGCKGLVPTSRIDYKFLYYYLGSIVDLLNDLGTGATFKELSGSKLKEIPAPVPPIAEQRRVVAILDEAFEGIATAKDNAEKNLQNARELFRGVVNVTIQGRLCHSRATGFGGNLNVTLSASCAPEEVKATSHLPSSWRWVRLAEVADLINGDRGKNYPNKSEYVAEGLPFINTGHIRADGSLAIDEMNFITRAKFDTLRSGKIIPGDLVYCLRGATLGKTAFVHPFNEGAVASSLVIIRPKSGLTAEYAYYFLTSDHAQTQMRTFENGAAQPNLGANSVKKYQIPLPPIPEQLNLVGRLDGLLAELERLESLYERKVLALDELKKSLLHQAFTGAL